MKNFDLNVFINNVLVFRRDSRLWFRKYQRFVEFAFRFVMSFAAFFGITHALNYSRSLASFPASLVVGLLGIVVPDIIIILLCVFTAMYEVYLASPVLALMTVAIFVVLYCFAARFSGKWAYAIVAVPLLMKFNMHYFIPLLLGITASPMAVFPCVVGVAVYYVLGIVNSAVVNTDVKNMDDILELYVNFLASLFADKEMLTVIIIFSLVIIGLWLVRRFRFDYSFEIAIAGGGFFMMIAFAIANIVIPGTIHIGAVIIGSFFSMLLMYIVQFFALCLNYKKVEETQFEDDQYYYYVKAVPKMDKYTEALVGDSVYDAEYEEAEAENEDEEEQEDDEEDGEEETEDSDDNNE